MVGSESAQGPEAVSGVGGRAGCAGTRGGERRRGRAGRAHGTDSLEEKNGRGPRRRRAGSNAEGLR
jgi:hypothetical protein